MAKWALIFSRSIFSQNIQNIIKHGNYACNYKLVKFTFWSKGDINLTQKSKQIQSHVGCSIKETYVVIYWVKKYFWLVSVFIEFVLNIERLLLKCFVVSFKMIFTVGCLFTFTCQGVINVEFKYYFNSVFLRFKN